MALLKIARMGHPVLRAMAMPVRDPTDPEVRRLAADMIETMLDAPGVGLAAPQVHVPLRLIVVRVPADRSGAADVPESVLVNPELEPLGNLTESGVEGCLSIPGLRGAVPRFARVGWRALDLEGRPIEGEAEGFHARVLQHEVDHLDGTLYIDRMPDLRLLAFNEEAAHLAAAMRHTEG